DDTMVEDAKKLLNHMGIPWIQSPSEGEAQAAYMNSKGYAWGVVSQDYDSLLFGSSRLVRNLTISGRRKPPGKNAYVNVEPEMIDLVFTYKKLGISREQLIDIGILLGTDFNPDGFKGIGPKNALKLIKTHGKLENITGVRELKDLNYQAIRNIFLKPEITESFNLKWNKPDTENIIQFLCKDRDFSENRIRVALERVERIEGKKSQTLEQWFF
ncbi:MAG: flap structure-specific endonuclease, partial [Nitrososphaeraceae archaeon]|nr:flap structure-specific endonuclease [Nitrososphaeraceae archaeon]